jgi:hypothetical protein
MPGGEQMKVDYDRLGELQHNLNTALTVMNHDVESAWDLQQVVGDARLGRAARDFSDSWDKHRLDIRDRLQWLHDSVKNISEQLKQLRCRGSVRRVRCPDCPVRPGACIVVGSDRG